MIRNLWKNIHLRCGCHDKPVKMSPHDSASHYDGQEDLTAFYACPKYYEEYREAGESPCFNRLSVKDYESMVETISTLLTNAEKERSEINLEGLAWKNKNGIEFRVYKHNRNGIYISMINKRVIKMH